MDQTHSPANAMPTRLIVGLVLTAGVSFLVIQSLVSQWDTVSRYDWSLDLGWLAVSAILVWFDFVLLFQLWRVILHSVSGLQLRFSAAYRISVLANLGKYIPGKIWAVAGMVILLAEEGIPAQHALVSTALHQAFTLIPGAVFITAVLGFKIWGGISAVAIACGLSMGILLLYPPIFSRILNLGLRIFGRPSIQFQLSFSKAFVLFWLYISAWVVYGASFWCMTLGLGLPAGPFWEVTAAYGAAYLIGFMAIFAPGGLGVREGVLAVVLGPYLPAGLGAAVAVVSRLWMTLVELAGLVPVLFGYGKSERRKS